MNRIKSNFKIYTEISSEENINLTWICSNNCFIIASSNHALFIVIKCHFDICNKKN